jgi:hypothetical protein
MQNTYNRLLLKKSNITILILSPLIIGASIYIFFRETNLLIYSWLGISEEIALIQNNKVNGLQLPDWVLYQLPDGLWLFSFVILLGAICKTYHFNIYISSFAFFLAITLEFLQKKYLPGIFDRADIIAYIIVLILIFILYKLFKL